MTGATVEVERANRRGTLVANPAMRARLAALRPPAPVNSPPPKVAPAAEAPLPATREKKIIDTEAVPDTSVPQIDPLIAEDRAVRERWRAEHMERVRRVETIACERWPAAFRLPRPPLMVGVREKMIEAGIGSADASALLRWWCARYDYLDAIAHREPRVDLEGTPVAIPAERDRYIAAIEVYGQHRAREMLAKIDARLAAASAPAARQDAAAD